VKLDAMGDVLRTTALLPLIAAAHPGASITWITRSESVPLMQNNPFVGEVITYGPDTTVHLLAREFDYLINLDAGKISAGLAALARATRKDGFVLHPHGYVTPTNDAARAWLEMGTNDVLKRSGTRAYQDWMKAILGLSDAQGERYVLELKPEERQAGRVHLESLAVDFTRPIIGLNTGAGGRWELKQWREDGYVELINELGRELGVQFLLLGGPSEEPRNARLRQAAPPGVVFDPGCHNPVRHFAALLGHCDVVVTGDTLAMHIALALGRRSVVLFGPTSAPEIELYGMGEKVIPDMTCLGCYKNTCDFVPNCMELISVGMVSAAVQRQLALRQPSAMADGQVA
jgi:ADP-heptose:LPS heptosyltransferase